LSLWTWLRKHLLPNSMTLSTSDMTEFWSLSASLFTRELAFRSAVNLMAKSISKCEYKTLEGGKEVRKDEWYLWNVEPNRNQNSSVFLTKLITRLYERNECLVIETRDGHLLVADNYQVKTYALFDYLFTGVTVDDLTFPQPFAMKDVLYFRLHNDDIRRQVNALYESYGTLAEYAEKSYKKSRGNKGILNISSRATGAPDFEKKLREMMNDKFKPYYDADSAVLPLPDGYTYTADGGKTYSNETTRDIRAQIDDVFTFFARAFGIPPALLLGDMADVSKTVDNLLTFAVDPLCDMIQEEINRKRYGKGVLKGNMLRIDTTAIKHIDIFEVAMKAEKLIGSAVATVNDIRERLGLPLVDEAWANTPLLSLNFTTVADALAKNAQKGSG